VSVGSAKASLKAAQRPFSGFPITPLLICLQVHRKGIDAAKPGHSFVAVRKA